MRAALCHSQQPLDPLVGCDDVGNLGLLLQVAGMFGQVRIDVEPFEGFGVFRLEGDLQLGHRGDPGDGHLVSCSLVASIVTVAEQGLVPGGNPLLILLAERQRRANLSERQDGRSAAKSQVAAFGDNRFDGRTPLRRARVAAAAIARSETGVSQSASDSP